MTLDEIDEELKRLPISPETKEDIEARAALVQKRYDVIAAEREAVARREAAERKKSGWGFPLANVPGDIGCVQIAGGRTVYADVIDGQRVMRLTPHEVRSLSISNAAWTFLNPELASL